MVLTLGSLLLLYLTSTHFLSYLLDVGLLCIIEWD
jgi:hypothetical protein